MFERLVVVIVAIMAITSVLLAVEYNFGAEAGAYWARFVVAGLLGTLVARW